MSHDLELRMTKNLSEVGAAAGVEVVYDEHLMALTE
jgi:hypothetical protein